MSGDESALREAVARALGDRINSLSPYMNERLTDAILALPELQALRRDADRVDELEQLIAAGLIAFQHTREYVDPHCYDPMSQKLLPALPGWSWFDWCERASAALAAGDAK